MIKLKSISIVLLASSIVCSIAFANCPAIIQNDSNQPWTVKFDTARGNVYFPETSCGQNGPCVIPPHSFINLEYTYNTSFAIGALNIKDYNGDQKTFGYYGNVSAGCPTIKKISRADSI